MMAMVIGHFKKKEKVYGYYYEDSAWEYVKDYTWIDLLEILEAIADARK